jgi:hypothetical protein
MLDELVAGYPVVVRQAVVWGEMDSYRHVNNVDSLDKMPYFIGFSAN